MRVAPEIFILVADAGSLGAAIANGLRANPGSDFSRKQSNLNLSLEKYGVKDQLSCSLIDFSDRSGSPQVKIILVPNFQPPIAACAAKEIVTSLIPENLSNPPLIIIPVFQTSLIEDRSPIFGVEIGPTTELTQALLHGIPKPPSLKLNCESLACLVQIIRVFNIPSFIIGSNFDQHGVSSIDQDLQEVTQIGEFLASCTGLSFSNGGIIRREKEKSVSREPWRALYG